MYKLLITAVCLIIFGTISAQHNAYFFDCNWEKIKLEKHYRPSDGDTCMIFASLRGCEENAKIFMDYDCDKNARIHYFRIYFNGNRWICVPQQNLHLAMGNDSLMQAVVYVEGFGKTFLTAVDRATMLSRQYGFRVIMFDWPTYRPDLKERENFKLTVSESKTVAGVFAGFLDSLNTFKSQHPHSFKSISLIMHSMGNLLMMHAAADGQLKIKDTLFNSIVLNSACVSQKNHPSWVEKINLQQHLYITKNNRDRTLRGAKLITGLDKQLGQQPMPPFASNALILDFSRVLNKEHNYFLYPSVLNEHPYIKNIYHAILSGMVPDFNNTERFIINSKKHAVEIFDLKEAQKGGIGINIGG